MKKMDSIPLSHLVWRGIKNKIGKIKYFTLPIMYLLIVLLIVPYQMVTTNQVKSTKLDSFNEVTITESDKLEFILKKYNLSKYQFSVLCGIVLTEAETNSYEDTYAVINTIYNRTHSKNWIRSVNSYFGNNNGQNLYYQAISPNQFTVYSSGSYKRNMNNTKSDGYKAIIDFLYTGEIMHNYLSFRSHTIKVNGSESFSSHGNNYFNVIKEENRV